MKSIDCRTRLYPACQQLLFGSDPLPQTLSPEPRTLVCWFDCSNAGRGPQEAQGLGAMLGIQVWRNGFRRGPRIGSPDLGSSSVLQLDKGPQKKREREQTLQLFFGEPPSLNLFLGKAPRGSDTVVLRTPIPSKASSSRRASAASPQGPCAKLGLLVPIWAL